MSNVTNLQDWRAAHDMAPSNLSTSSSDTSIISRGAEHDRLSELTFGIAAAMDKLLVMGFSVDYYASELKAQQPAIDEFNRYCPPATSRYSPQASQSKATLDSKQVAARDALFKALQDLLTTAQTVLRHVEKIATLRTHATRMRNIMQPKLLQQVDWDDPDPTLSEVIDAAANPQGFLDQAIAWLDEAVVQFNEQKWSEAYNNIGQAERVCAQLSIVNSALLDGAFLKEQSN